MDNRPIGIFDSGVGGITVFAEIIKLLPNENIIYLGDTARLPYGTKSKQTIINYTKQAIEFFVSKNVKAVVIACGTATSQSLEEIKDNYQIPIIGIINPTVERIGDITGKIGVIGTSGTINSMAWDKEIKKIYPQVEIISKPCPILAQLAEEGWTNNEVARLAIKEYLEPLKQANISKLILGCTHYPLFNDIINQELEYKVEIINTGEKCAQSLKQLLTQKNIEKGNTKGEYNFYLTDIESNFVKVANTILAKQYSIEEKKINLVKL